MPPAAALENLKVRGEDSRLAAAPAHFWLGLPATHGAATGTSDCVVRCPGIASRQSFAWPGRALEMTYSPPPPAAAAALQPVDAVDDGSHEAHGSTRSGMLVVAGGGAAATSAREQAPIAKTRAPACITVHCAGAATRSSLMSG